MWKEFGRFFKVNDEELSEIEERKKTYKYGGPEEKNFFEVVKMILSDASRNFSKVRIYEAVKKHHPTQAEKFKLDFYKTGSLYIVICMCMFHTGYLCIFKI